MYILPIVSSYNHLCKIYYAYKKKSKCTIVIKKKKNVIDDISKIYIYSNIGNLDI